MCINGGCIMSNSEYILRDEVDNVTPVVHAHYKKAVS